MSCERYEDRLVDLARGEELEAADREPALAHVQGCLRCTERLEEERAVTSALRAFAARTAGAEAPARVEWALLRALGEAGATARPSTRPSRGAELLLLAAAAAILAAVVMVPPHGDRRAEPGSRTAAAGAPAIAPIGPAAPLAGATENAEFVSLGYPDDLRELDSLQVVSVELTRPALAAFGWPEEAGGTGPVKAEVIVGQDGVARAIRFVD